MDRTGNPVTQDTLTDTADNTSGQTLSEETLRYRYNEAAAAGATHLVVYAYDDYTVDGQGLINGVAGMQETAAINIHDHHRTFQQLENIIARSHRAGINSSDPDRRLENIQAVFPLQNDEGCTIPYICAEKLDQLPGDLSERLEMARERVKHDRTECQRETKSDPSQTVFPGNSDVPSP